jgi:hypothetical protein
LNTVKGANSGGVGKVIAKDVVTGYVGFML